MAILLRLLLFFFFFQKIRPFDRLAKSLYDVVLNNLKAIIATFFRLFEQAAAAVYAVRFVIVVKHVLHISLHILLEKDKACKCF